MCSPRSRRLVPPRADSARRLDPMTAPSPAGPSPRQAVPGLTHGSPKAALGAGRSPSERHLRRSETLRATALRLSIGIPSHWRGSCATYPPSPLQAAYLSTENKVNDCSRDRRARSGKRLLRFEPNQTRRLVCPAGRSREVDSVGKRRERVSAKPPVGSESAIRSLTAARDTS